MHRIDGSGAVVALPTPEVVGTPGYFDKGNPGLGVKATVVTADWANAVQEEIAYTITQAGLTLDKTNLHQLYSAILSIAGSAAKYKHTQGSTSASWTVTHNLGSIDHMIQIYDGSGVQILPDTITRGANSDTVTFSSAQAGSALLIKIA